ncbi:MAG TPA: DUF4160 domain-containing protein [Stellaceae bacterium]|nr:DUF4160 domain-containing protein [Stellaceae bacterium]
MPVISAFYGIIIRMFYDEHGPPHFHVAYQGYQAVIDIRTLEVKIGSLPRRALNLALDWAELHQDELLANWDLIEEGRPLNNINPLE